MDHFVTIDRFPDGLQFPPDLGDRIQCYDVLRPSRLLHPRVQREQGQSSTRLLGPLSEDWGYRRSLEDLFRLCVPDDAPRHGLKGWLDGLSAQSPTPASIVSDPSAFV